MKARSSSYALGIFTFGLLATTSLVQPVSSARAATSEAQTGWAINRVASAASGSYCTMAQKYSDNTVMTLAKNQAGEYSLAFDFAKVYFPDAKSTTVSLRPAGASAQTFDVTPQNEKVVVIGLGANDSFVTAMKSSGKLDFEAGGQTHTFSTSKFASGADELSTCLSSMKPKAVPAQDAPDKKTITAKAPSAEQLTQAPINNEMIDLKTENAQLKQAMVQERQSYENQQSSSQAALAVELQEKLQLLEKENQALRTQKNASPAVDSKTAEELAKAKAELAAAQSLNQTLQSQSSQISQQQKINGASAEQLAEMQKQNEALKAQIASLSPKASAADQVAVLQKQNADMKAQLDAANQQLQAKVAQAPLAIPTTQRIDQTALKENAELKQQLANLQAQMNNASVSKMPSPEEMKVISALQVENANLKQQLSSNAKAPSSGVSGETLRDLNNKLEMAQAENQSLKKQLDAIQSDEDGKLKVASASNWDLEQATTRYQESQREIRRLGALVDTQKTQCTQQKKEIEAMLFDPAVSDKAQIEKFHAMEDQIAELQAKAKSPQADPARIAELEKKLAESQSSQAKLVDLQQQLSAAQAKSQADQAQLAEVQKQLQVAQAAQASAQASQATALAAQAKIAELEKQAQAGQAAQASAQASQAAALAAQAKIAELEKQAQAAKMAQATAQAANATAQQAQAKVEQLEKQAMANKINQDRISLLEQQLNSAKIASTVPAAKIAPAAGVPVPAVTQSDLPVPTMAAAKVTPVTAAAIAPAVVAAPVAAAAPVVAPTSPVASAVISPAVNVNFQSPEVFAGMLKEAGINVRGSVENVASVGTDSYRAYRWKTDSLFGSAEQRAMKTSRGFDTAVQDYLDRAKSRCAGDFAAVPADVASGADKAKAFEIACIGGKIDTSASVLFTYGNQVMTTVAHEGKSEAMDIAMEARDRMASQLGGLKTATR